MTTMTRRTLGKTIAAALGATLIATSAFAAGHSQNHTVKIKGFAFESAELTINAGDTVTFINEDSAPHTATGKNGEFETGRLGKGEEASVKFENAGTFEYFCKFHRKMTAKITVIK